MLTAAEKQACRTVTRTDWRQAACYGTKEDGFCPIGAVAALRGVELYWWESRHHYSCLPEACCAVTGQRPRPMRRAEIANYDRFDAARRDVLTWVGFPKTKRALCAPWRRRARLFFLKRGAYERSTFQSHAPY